MQSAFGVEHADLVSKAGLGLIPKAVGGGGIRMGGFGTMKAAATKGYQRGQSKGLGKVSSALRAAGGAIKSSPGTTALAGTGVVGTGATASYLHKN
jgi:hypothetical protein